MSRDKRGNRTQEVDGSSPFSSTRNTPHQQLSAFADRVGDEVWLMANNAVVRVFRAREATP